MTGCCDSSSKQEGDPARAAQIIVDLAGAAGPPLRLLLGKSALRLARDITARRSAEDEKWATVTELADFDDTTSNQQPATSKVTPRPVHGAARPSTHAGGKTTGPISG